MSPSPTPVLVQLVGQEPPPVWLGPLLTGAFVLLAAIIALLSLRWSDLRKLAREDRRQWDAELKASYVAIGEHVRVVRNVLIRNEGTLDYTGDILSTTEEALRGIREHIRLFELIAPAEVTKAAEDVAKIVAAVWQRAFTESVHEDFTLRWAVQEGLKIEVPLDALRDRIRESLRV
jgi:hypothetical protein